ncbi:MAG TPA: glycosyltransferase [Chlamydiales bacterium]|nr:glycosyltransferase [Chlamydiales bacterium]
MKLRNQVLDEYRPFLTPEIINDLFQAASLLKNCKIVHVNSTREGGGVAEILSRMIPLTKALGLDVHWKVLQGTDAFFQCTKMFHNSLQGQQGVFPDAALLQAYEETTAKNAALLKDTLQNADIVFIHDPQPLALLAHFPDRKGKWIWRCHIDLSSPSKDAWQYLKNQIDRYDATIFSLKEFAQNLPHPTYFIPPSIDPLSEKNIELKQEEIQHTCNQLGIDINRSFILQVSRFDRFKDPLGVIEAYRLAKLEFPGLQLALAGSEAVDDPEGTVVLKEVKVRAKEDPDIHILLLPPASHRAINALQRRAAIILQKSLKEGFGLTVSEALWKSKPVIGGNAGGIRLQVIDQQTGFIIHTIQEAAHRIKFLLQNPDIGQKFGEKGKQLVREKFLMPRHLRDYLTVMAAHWH